ncbi:hypothetical protein J6590_081972 [Homalodisca vitripennis]|nr:hypothetical protein J6590_081972 [Homalodisca vitripennis]
MPNPRLTKKQRLPLSAKRRKNRGENLRRWREEHTGKNNISLEASNESQPEVHHGTPKEDEPSLCVETSNEETIYNTTCSSARLYFSLSQACVTCVVPVLCCVAALPFLRTVLPFYSRLRVRFTYTLRLLYFCNERSTRHNPVFEGETLLLPGIAREDRNNAGGKAMSTLDQYDFLRERSIQRVQETVQND